MELTTPVNAGHGPPALSLEEIGRLSPREGSRTKPWGTWLGSCENGSRPTSDSANLIEPDRSTLVPRRRLGCGPKVSAEFYEDQRGLAGLVASLADHGRDATKHPRFKYFREAGEDEYHCFLSALIDQG